MTPTEDSRIALQKSVAARWKSYLVTCGGTAAMAMMLRLGQGLMQEVNPPGGYYGAIKSYWRKVSAQENRGFDAVGPTAAVVAIPVMMFVADALNRIDGQRSPDADEMTSNDRAARAVVVSNVFSTGYFFAAVACWMLSLESICSSRLMLNELVACGGALLASAFFDLDAGNDSTRFLNSRQVVGSSDALIDELESLDAKSVHDAPSRLTFWSLRIQITSFVTSLMLAGSIMFDSARQVSRESSTVKVSSASSWSILNLVLITLLLIALVDALILFCGYITFRWKLEWMHVQRVSQQRGRRARRRIGYFVALAIIALIPTSLVLAVYVYSFAKSRMWVSLGVTSAAILGWLFVALHLAHSNYASDRKVLIRKALGQNLARMESLLEQGVPKSDNDLLSAYESVTNLLPVNSKSHSTPRRVRPD